MKEKSIYTRKLGNVIARSALLLWNSKKYHVIAGFNNNWKVIRAGRIKAMKSFSRKDQAIRYAKKIALSEAGMLYVHESDGSLKTKISYVK